MKPSFIISCPIDTYSGYGARSRDLVKAIIELGKYEVSILSQRWGNTPWGFIEDHPEWQFLNKHILPDNKNLPFRPKIWAQITVPNEFQPMGDYNIGISAGIETTICHVDWVEGFNRMDLNFVSSEFSKAVIERSKYNKQDPQGNLLESVELTKPIEVLFEGVDLTKYFPSKDTNNFDLNEIKEPFAYLFVGHWLPGNLGEDRKNVGLMIQTFYEAFKNKPKPPALILKTSSGPASYLDRDSILDKIYTIKNTIEEADTLPNVYLLHGELTDEEMNNLYNHKKVKAMVSLTKGEGFGRPLLEFSLTKKPIIASEWSGHMDFLEPKYNVLIEGELSKVHPSVGQTDMLLESSEWFNADPTRFNYYMQDVFVNYKKYTKKSMLQYHKSKNNFGFDSMADLLSNYLDKYLPEFPNPVAIKLPELTLPKLEKTTNV